MQVPELSLILTDSDCFGGQVSGHCLADLEPSGGRGPGLRTCVTDFLLEQPTQDTF